MGETHTKWQARFSDSEWNGLENDVRGEDSINVVNDFDRRLEVK